MKLGFHIDLRIQVMPMAFLKQHAGHLRDMGYDTLLIEWEASFPFRKHAIISNSVSYTRAEILSFLSHCRRLNLDVIPLQQCFGHVEYILQHHRYKRLRENERDLSQVCPSRREVALKVFSEIFGEISEVHSSQYIHIGGDETRLLGSCPACRKAVRQHGRSQLYVDYAREVAEVVIGLGKVPVIWADMLLKYPKQAEQMPPETVFIDWRYGDITAKETVPPQFSQFEIWGSPAIRCHPDDHSFTDWKSHFANLQSFVPFARRFNHACMIVTSWSTSGCYDIEWGSNGQVLNMLPSRHVYPLPGFRMLQEGYIKAARSSGTFSSEDFVVGYFQNRFGLPTKIAALLWKALVDNSLSISLDTSLLDIRKALATAKKAKAMFSRVVPRRNKIEWSHFVLQASLRVLDLRVREIEALSQSDECSPITLRRLGRRARGLLSEAEVLTREYIRLNDKALLSEEISRDISYRYKRLLKLNLHLNREVFEIEV